MNLSEEQHILETSRTDPSRFAPVYDAFYPRIFGYVFRRTGNYHLARDITADTFLKAVLKLPAFEWRGVSILSWLFQIATNELRMYFRRHTYESAVFSQLPDQFILDRHLHQVFEQERLELEFQYEQYREFLDVQKALLELPLRYQEVISLRYFEQKSIAEIALILAKKEGTVKSLLSRGIERITRIVNPTVHAK
jgi:RNA polymerase sigma-70 factor (ECF subfamily)